MVSYMNRAPDGSAPVSTVHYRVWWYDASETLLGYEQYIVQQTIGIYPSVKRMLSTNTWYRIQWTTPEAPAGAAKAKLGFYAPHIGGLDMNMFIDDVIIAVENEWLPWGGTDGVTNLISVNGNTILTNPTGVSNSTLEYYNMALKVEFVTEDFTQTPVLEDLTVRFLMRPEDLYGVSFAIVAASHVEHGMQQDSRTAHDILSDLKTARDSKAPIEFIDIYGTTRQVYVSAVRIQAIEQHVGDYEGGVPNIEHRVIVNLTEVG